MVRHCLCGAKDIVTCQLLRPDSILLPFCYEVVDYQMEQKNLKIMTVCVLQLADYSVAIFHTCRRKVNVRFAKFLTYRHTSRYHCSLLQHWMSAYAKSLSFDPCTGTGHARLTLADR